MIKTFGNLPQFVHVYLAVANDIGSYLLCHLRRPDVLQRRLLESTSRIEFLLLIPRIEELLSGLSGISVCKLLVEVQSFPDFLLSAFPYFISCQLSGYRFNPIFPERIPIHPGLFFRGRGIQRS